MKMTVGTGGSMKKNNCLTPCIVVFFLICICGCKAEQNRDGGNAAEETEMVTERKGPDTKRHKDIQEEAAWETETLEKTQTRNSQKLRFVDAWGDWFEAEINSNLKMHPYDWNCLSGSGDEILYEGDSGYTIKKGIDVSHHQGGINWEKVKAAGYEFAFIRMAYRGYGEEGSLNLDREYKGNIAEAKRAGLLTGVYIFSQAVNEAEAVEEAEMAIEHLKGVPLDLPVVYDPELIRDDEGRTDHVTKEQFTQNTIAFCEKIKEAGYEPMIYSNMYWEAFLFDLERLQDYKIWYADYERIPQTPYDFTFWQYSESGRVDGVNGTVDLNVWFVPTEQSETADKLVQE